jgi:ATP-dependent Lhr-like helicase
MGRTGRREGATANTTFFCEDSAAVLQAIALVELARTGWVEPVIEQTRCWAVLVHQLLALTLQFGAVSAERCWEQIRRVPDFSGIEHNEFIEVVEHMKREDYLFESGGLLSMGQKAERVYGRRNFLELYAVFSSPVLYRVVTEPGRDIGSLEQDFVDRLVENMSAFLLGGRAWVVDRVNHEDRVVVVDAAPRGMKPSWGGFIPQLLGFDLCQRIRGILADSASYPYVHEAAVRQIEERRADLGELFRRSGPAVQLDGAVARWWTFAGGRINHTLKYALEIAEGWKVVADNFLVRIEGNGINHETVRTAIRTLSDAGWWQDPRTVHTVLSRLPDYRLSKFQPCLPERYAIEMVGAYLLDIPGTVRWLGGLG